MKVVVLAPYPVNNILTEVLGCENRKIEHPATWVVNTVESIKTFYPNIELHVVTESVKICKTIAVCRDDVFFHIVRSGSAIPFTKRGFPWFVPVDVCSLFLLNRYRLLKEIKRINPDLIHAHGTESSYGITAATSDYPYIISIQGIISELIVNSWTFRYFVIARLEKYTLRTGKFFVAKTPFAQRFVHRINSSAIVFNIENPMHEAFFSVKRTGKIENIMLFVGSVIREKGIEDLMLALANIPVLKLKIIGSGDSSYVDVLKKKADSLGVLGRIQWLGQLSSEGIAIEFETAALLVLPSYMESSPNVVSEAMCAGLPVVATKVGGIPDMVIDGKTGLLVGPHDVEQLARAIQSVISNPKDARRMGLAAREEGKKRYSPQRIAQCSIDAYHYVLTANSQFPPDKRSSK
jgi:glycosyltransferase involved in cell wall biosynthesis